MVQISGDPRGVPRRQLPQMTSRLDNYIANNWYYGNPNLTDETDVFEELYREDDEFNAERLAEQSIQRWNGLI